MRVRKQKNKKTQGIKFIFGFACRYIKFERLTFFNEKKTKNTQQKN